MAGTPASRLEGPGFDCWSKTDCADSLRVFFSPSIQIPELSFKIRYDTFFSNLSQFIVHYYPYIQRYRKTVVKKALLN